MQQAINKLLEQRIVPLTGQIDDQVAQSVLAMMFFLFDRDSSSPINGIRSVTPILARPLAAA